jgi:hypothetical protein
VFGLFLLARRPTRARPWYDLAACHDAGRCPCFGHRLVVTASAMTTCTLFKDHVLLLPALPERGIGS